MSANDLFNIAKDEIQKLEPNEEFLVKELFKGYFWKRQSKSDRLTLGTLFLNYAKTSNDLEILSKTSSNQQMYKKL